MAIDFPNSPSVNDQYTVGDRTWTWNGTYWQTSTSTSTFTASDSEPVDADAGDIWFDSTIGKTFVNYGGNWVEIGAAGSVVDVIADSDGDTKVQVESSADEDKIRFSTAGTERMIVDSSGNVGIGTASPAAYLHVFADLAAEGIRLQYNDGDVQEGAYQSFYDYAGTRIGYVGYPGTRNMSLRNETSSGTLSLDTNSTQRLTIDSSGNVGIATTSPTKPLHVYSATLDQVARFESGDNRGGIEFADSGTTDAAKISGVGNDLRVRTGSVDVLTVTDGGNVGIGTTSPSDALDLAGGSIRFGQDSSGNAVAGPFGIKVYGASSTGVAASLESAVYYRTNPNAWSFENSTGDDILCIDIDDERVGIGTDSPAANLQVVSENRAFSVLDTGVNNWAEVGFTSLGSDAPAFGQISGYDVQIKTGTSRAGLATRLHVDNNGNVGIGTTNPTRPLDIAIGGANFSGYVSVSSYISAARAGGSGNTLVVQNSSPVGSGVVRGIQVELGPDGNEDYTDSGDDFIRFITSNNQEIGGIRGTGSASVSYGTSSDYRLKAPIEEISDGLSLVRNIVPMYGKWLNQNDPDRIYSYFIAHELQEHVPDAVSGSKDEVDENGDPEYQSVDYGKLTPVLTAAIKDLDALVQTLTARIEALEAG